MTIKIVNIIVSVSMFAIAATAFGMKKPYYGMLFCALGIIALIPLLPVFKPGGGGHGGGGGGGGGDGGSGICISDICPSNIFVKPDGLVDKVIAVSQGSGTQKYVDSNCFNRQQMVTMTEDVLPPSDLPVTPINITFPQSVMRIEFKCSWSSSEKPQGGSRSVYLLIPVMNNSIADLDLIRAAWLCERGKPGNSCDPLFDKTKPICGFGNNGNNWDTTNGGNKYGNANDTQLEKLGAYIWKHFSDAGYTDKSKIYENVKDTVQFCSIYVQDVRYAPGIYTDNPKNVYDLSNTIPDPFPSSWLSATQAQDLCGTGSTSPSGGTMSNFWTRGTTKECKLDPYKQPYACSNQLSVYCVGNGEKGPNCTAQWMDLPLVPPSPPK